MPTISSDLGQLGIWCPVYVLVHELRWHSMVLKSMSTQPLALVARSEQWTAQGILCVGEPGKD
eukprot:5693843-Amphidinium_carterae.1